MKTQPIVPARLSFTAEGTPFAPQFGDVYHSQAGALEQARHVFLAGNGLPERWAGRERFVVLETGFGLGNNFLATWAAWRASEPARRCERLVFVSIERHPLTQQDLAQALAASPAPELAQQLVAAWPQLTPNLHTLEFDDARVRLLLGLGDVAALLPELVVEVDAFYLDGFAPSLNPEMWQPRLLKRLGRLAAPGATAATWSVARTVRDGLTTAGFEVQRAPGFAGKRDMTVARFAPRFVPARAAAALRTPRCTREALIVGAGLAGCAAAWALAREGWRCRVFDRESAPAQATSGNEGGLFHGTFQGEDGLHSRWFRAAALRTAQVVQPWLSAKDVSGPVSGQLEGLLRLEPKLDDAQAHMLLVDSGLPGGYLQWLDLAAARALSGVQLPSGAWFYPAGGWLAPRELAAHWLRSSGAVFDGKHSVVAVRRHGEVWQLVDDAGKALAEAPVIVLANAGGAAALAASAQQDDHDATQPPMWPLSALRGQTTIIAAGAPGLHAPLLPLSGAGYVLPAHGAQVLCGATSQADDAEAALRDADHRYNLDRLALLTGSAPQVERQQLGGRVGWRLVTADRLPLIGAVPDLAALKQATRRDQPRLLPRLADASGGLYVFAALGSRGIASAALGAELLASWISGAPRPVEADLRDALDPARFLARAWRREVADSARTDGE